MITSTQSDKEVLFKGIKMRLLWITFLSLALNCSILAYPISDNLHLHLNGSYSNPFLKKTAKQNDQLPIYNKLLLLQIILQKRIDKAQYEHVMPLVWKEFSYIYQIVQTLDDIKQGTIDVILHQNSPYVEIRTIPKVFPNQTLVNYVDAFVDGLEIGNLTNPNTKAVGLLSINRAEHDYAQALEILDLVLKYKKLNKPIVGLDISGDPDTMPRSLSGTSLYDILNEAFANDISVSIHFAETDYGIEHKDSDVVLDVIEQWQKKWVIDKVGLTEQATWGKVRLSHAIYPTPNQIKRIQALNIPIEICPTAHRYIGWWEKNKPHPILSIYSEPNSPIVLGTDDTAIFKTSIQREQALLNSIIKKPADSQLFRFGSTD